MERYLYVEQISTVRLAYSLVQENEENGKRFVGNKAAREAGAVTFVPPLKSRLLICLPSV